MSKEKVISANRLGVASNFILLLNMTYKFHPFYHMQVHRFVVIICLSRQNLVVLGNIT